MEKRFDDPATQEAWETVRALNDCWTQGAAEKLADFFHPRMVAITIHDHERMEGREECAAAWQRFAEKSRVLNWKEIAPRIQLHGATAVVSYYFEILIERDGEQLEMTGRDLWVLIREQDRWLAAASHGSPYP